MKYNLSKIMHKAWELFRKLGLSFAECLHRAWAAAKAEPVNASRVSEAKAAAGITEETNTWSGWQKLGYEVIHGSKALFGADLIWATRGDGKTYKARFFGASQVHPYKKSPCVNAAQSTTQEQTHHRSGSCLLYPGPLQLSRKELYEFSPR